MKKFIKITTSLAALIFIFSAALCSCDSKKENNDLQANTAENATEAATVPEIPDNLPDRDYEGYTFRIYLDENSYKDMYIDEEVGEIVDDAVYKRNKIVEERFNINFATVLHDSEWSRGMDGSKSIKAGEDAFDLMLTHARIAYQYANQNMVIDWLAEMPYANLEAIWWNQDVNDDSTMFGKLYCTAGDISYRGLNCTFCMIFNKDLFKNLALDYPYDDVVNGKWTLDKFISIVKSGSLDLNGDGQITPDADRYGLYAGNVWGYPTNILYCGGDRVIAKGTDGAPVLSVYSERTIDIFSKFFDALESGSVCVGGEAKNIWQNPGSIDIFKGGRSLFTQTGMSGLKNLRDMEEEIGVLPVPKYNESTPKYYSLVEAYGGLLTVPVTVSDFERTSIITEALCAEGYKIIVPAYYEKALKTKYSRDDESEIMLDYIKNSAVYDYGYMNYELAGDLSSVGATLVQSASPNFASLYEKNSEKALKNIDKFIEKMENS